MSTKYENRLQRQRDHLKKYGPPKIYQREPENVPMSWKLPYVDAMNTGQWIFDPRSREWYSPEEFKAQFERYVFTDVRFDMMEVRDPMEGIAAGNKKMLEMQNKLEDLTKRVLQYYKDKK